jgi:ammonium transporter, Amt family
VFFMQLGFFNLELGYGRTKNVQHILAKNTINVMLTALCWWAVGFAFAYGNSAGGFIG